MALTDQLIHYWRLEESSSGTIWNDYVGSAHLVKGGTVGNATGKQGQCLNFSAANGRVEAQDNNVASITSGGARTSFTVAAWMRPTYIATETYGVSKRQGAANREWLLGFHPVNGWRLFIHVGAGSEEIINSGTLAVLNTWAYLVAGFNLATNRIFISVNGAAASTQAVVGTVPTGVVAIPFRIGCPEVGAGIDFQGDIDEVMFWRGRQISDAEIAELYNSGNGRSAGSILGMGVGFGGMRKFIG